MILRQNPLADSPRILVYSGEPEPWRDWLTEHDCPGTIATACTRDELQHGLEHAEIVLTRRLDSERVERAPHLRWIQSMNAGIEDLISPETVPEGVTITRAVDLFGGFMAEYVFAELLARVRALAVLREQQMRHQWAHVETETLAGMTMGVAGLGSIGREIVRVARALDMRVHGLSQTGASASVVDEHFLPDAWIPFVRDVDVLVLVMPITPETDSVVDANVLRAMRAHALLVNVGRGRLVVEKDLISAVRERWIAGAILDVFEHEPLPPSSPLWSLPGVTVTPHISGPSTISGVCTLFLGNVGRYLRGEPLLGVVDRTRGY